MPDVGTVNTQTALDAKTTKKKIVHSCPLQENENSKGLNGLKQCFSYFSY